MPATPDHILWGDGQQNMGGIQTTCYYAPLSSFASVKTVPSLDTNPSLEASVTITGTHTFKNPATKGFWKLYCTEDAGMLESEGVGEKDGRSFRPRLKVFIPGGQKEAAGFLNWVNNTGGIFLAKDAEGRVRQVGTEQYPAKVEEGSESTTETADGRKGITLTVSCASPGPAPFYDGTISTAPGGSS